MAIMKSFVCNEMKGLRFYYYDITTMGQSDMNIINIIIIIRCKKDDVPIINCCYIDPDSDPDCVFYCMSLQHYIVVYCIPILIGVFIN